MIICVVGPTGVGKSKLGVSLAKIYNGEVINADSVAIYKYLDIGSAKITLKEQEGIPHHLIDVANLEDNYTIYDYQKDARKAISQILEKGKVPILVGGSGLYIKSALYDYNLEEENTKDKEYEELSNEDIYNKIKAYDESIEIDKNNRRRLVRMLNKISKEIIISKDAKLIYDNVIFIGLTTDTNLLYERINKRLDDMIIPLIDEVDNLYRKNIKSKALENAIGYKELFPFFRHEQTLESCVEQIKQNSRNYAKRQFTFFKHQLPVNWVNVNYEDFSKTILECVKIIDNQK